MSVSLRAELQAVGNPGDVPAGPSREDLARWLAGVDVMPAVYDELCADPKPADVDDDDLDDMEGYDVDAAVAKAWEDFGTGLAGLLDPASHLSLNRRRELTEQAEREWLDVQPFVKVLETTLVERARWASAVAQLEKGTQRRDRAERHRREAEDKARPLLTDAVRQGLERRVGLYLRAEDGATMLCLLALGAQMPPGISCCEGAGCGVVFRPQRRYAALCPRCHSNPRTPALQYERLDRGGSVLYSPAGPIRHHVCARAGCDKRFFPKQANALYCSPGCRQAAYRERNS